MARSKKPTRRQRHHGVLPAGFRWRDGRPRWEPSPARRKQGWKGHDLKDAWGKYLPLGPAVDKATTIAAAVAAWAKGAAVPGAFVAIAPAGAEATGLAPVSIRSIGAMLDDYLASPEFKRLGAQPQKDYPRKLRRFVNVLAGDDEARVPAVRAMDMDSLLPPAFGEKGAFALKNAYSTLRDVAGDSQAHSVMAIVSAWLSWCVEEKHLWPANPAKLVKRKTPEGRIVLWEWPELIALVRAAEAAGHPSIADAIILGIDLSWSQQDLLALTWGQISADYHVKHRRIKTGNAGNPQLLKIGERRVDAMRARLGGVVPAPKRHVLICETSGEPWVTNTFRMKFREIRAEVARKFPDAAERQFRDLRDTSITICNDAGLSATEICSRSLHDPTRAAQVIQKHYGAVGQRLSDDAAARVDAHHARMGYTFEEQLALPPPAVLAAE